MKAFRYPLQRVEDARRIREDARRAELAKAAGARALEQSRLQDMRQSLREYLDRAAPAEGAETAAWTLRQRDQYGRAQVRRQTRQGRKVREAERAEDTARRALWSARRDVRQMERHRERLLRSWEADHKRLEQAALDELASVRHWRGQSTGDDHG